MHWLATLTHPQNRQRKNGEPRRAVFRQLRGDPGHLNLVLLDTSGSTLNRRALNRALGASAWLYRQSYLQRQHFAMISFGNNQVQWLLQPQRAGQQLKQRFSEFNAGGGTPLREGLLFAKQALNKQQRQQPNASQTLYLLTDGLSRDSVEDLQIDYPLVVVDTEQSAVRLGRARQLAKQLNGHYLHLDQLTAASLSN